MEYVHFPNALIPNLHFIRNSIVILPFSSYKIMKPSRTSYFYLHLIIVSHNLIVEFKLDCMLIETGHGK